VFEIRTTTGRRLRATARHPILTPDGWKAVGELMPGSLVACARRQPVFGGTAGSLSPSRTLDRSSALALAEKLAAPRISEMASNDILWDRVASVMFVGREPVYDLVIPGTHNFIANGVVAHNSGELEQVADLVLFIYREDYYNPETEKKNIAELIIAKHRNGPIGMVELFFHKEHSRFGNLEKRRA